MRFKFKVQDFQTAAVQSVVDCFKGQPQTGSIEYRIDPGNARTFEDDKGFKNGTIRLAESQLLANIQDVQKRQNLPLFS